jgi:branched-chain amino acid transport system permease protein
VVDLSLVWVVGIIAGIYSLLAIGLNMHWGDTGLLNFAHASFFAVGAYTAAILTTVPGSGPLSSRVVGFGLPPLASFVVAPVLAGLLGVGVALTSVRLEGDYLAMVTLGVAEIVRLFIHNEAWLTSGAQGIKDIPRPFSALVPPGVSYDLVYLLFVAAAVVASYVVFRRLSTGPFGRVLHAVREDEAVPRALGKRTDRFKLKSFGIGAAIAGLAGAFWSHYVFAISPTTFLANLTFLIWAAVIIGGAGSYLGAIAGTVFVVVLRQGTRFLPQDLPFASDLPYLRLVIVGAALIGVLYFRPQGLFGDEARLEAGQPEGGE